MRALLRRLSATLLLAAGLFVPVVSAEARPLDQVKAEGSLRVALYADNAPFSFEKAGKPHGIEVDLAKALADKLGVRLDLRLVDAGENVDGDFRLNLWKGDLAGSALADLMLHVPNDRMLANRNEQIFLTTPYFEQRLAFAYRKGKLEGFDSIRDVEGNEVAVEGASASDIMLLTAEGGRYRKALKHFKDFDQAAKAYLAGEAPILAGTRAGIEAALHAAGASADENPVVEVAVPGLVKTHWALGGAVRSDSRDLAYAVGEIVTAMAGNGQMKAICDGYGVGFTPPEGY